MTEELFRQDSYLREAEAEVVDVVALSEGGHGVILDRTIFYPLGGGQPGDVGQFASLDSDARFAVADTRKNLPEAGGRIAHLLAADSAAPEVGARLRLEPDWEKRYRHMRMHSCLHLLSAILPYPVTGGQVGADSGRIDFDIPEASLDKEALTESLNRLVQEDHAVGARWISAEELQANPGLVKTMSVQPPLTGGRVRLIEIEGCDLQPCGGTHVLRTGEIGRVAIRKIEKKGAQNRRVRVGFV